MPSWFKSWTVCRKAYSLSPAIQRRCVMLTGNPVQLFLAFMTLLAFCTLPILGISPNRILTPQGQYLAMLWHLPWVAEIAAGTFVLFLPGLGRSRRWKRLLAFSLSATMLALLTWVGGDYASQSVIENPRARISFGGGYWALVLIWWLMAMDSLPELVSVIWMRSLLSVIFMVPIAVMIGAGHLDQMSLLKEYQANRMAFDSALVEHLTIVGVTVVLASCLGLWLGIRCYRHRTFERLCLNSLSLIQTIPSIALFGLLLAPLSALAKSLPWLSVLGISGIGKAPAIIALLLYSLLPMVRAIVTGLKQVSPQILDAARGMGMTASQCLWQIAFPLAVPVILSGLRVTAVQAMGLTMVAALIGAGGFGAIMFRGLSGSALDLVLLGVLPVIGLAALVDTLFKLLVQLTQNRLQSSKPLSLQDLTS